KGASEHKAPCSFWLCERCRPQFCSRRSRAPASKNARTYESLGSPVVGVAGGRRAAPQSDFRLFVEAPFMMLSPYRVLDLTDTRAELASFVLAGMGADVIKVEGPGGSASRRAAPIDDAQPGDMQSLRFHAFNRGKRSVVLDLTSAHGRDQLMRLVASADFL